jgi:hypothetical protein
MMGNMLQKVVHLKRVVASPDTVGKEVDVALHRFYKDDNKNYDMKIRL